MPFGLGSSLLGNGSEISGALQSRRMGDPVSPLSQVSLMSPMGSSSPTPALPIPASQLPGVPIPVNQMQQSAKPPQDESSLIVKALIERLKTLGSTSAPQL